MPLEEPCLKLKNKAEAARILREKYGLPLVGVACIAQVPSAFTFLVESLQRYTVSGAG